MKRYKSKYGFKRIHIYMADHPWAYARGHRTARSRLWEEDVHRIRRMRAAGQSMAHIARLLGVSYRSRTPV
jgi:hypothetical protein